MHVIGVDHESAPVPGGRPPSGRASSPLRPSTLKYAPQDFGRPMAFDPRAACRVVLGDGGHDDFHAAALAEKADRRFRPQGLASWRMCAFVSRATQARSGILGLSGASSIGTSPQASDTLTLERFTPGQPVRISGDSATE